MSNLILNYGIPAGGLIDLIVTGTNIFINWGTSSTGPLGTGTYSRGYTSAYTGAVTISGNLTGFGSGSTSARGITFLLSVSSFNSNTTIYTGAFSNAQNLRTVPLVFPAGTKPTNLSRMFLGTTAFNTNISNWDVSEVTTMASMFQGSSNFTNGNQPLLWGTNTSKVQDMSDMFSNAISFNQDISNWDVSGVTTMLNMFQGARNFNQNISNWNVSKVTTMLNMFNGARAFNQDISNWDVSSVLNTANMFNGASNFNNGNQPLTWGIKTNKITNMNFMFQNATSFNQDISSWDVSSVTTMLSMFFGATNFNNGNQPLTWGGKTSNVTDMTAMFRTATSFNQDISGWDVSSVTNMTNMFLGATKFNNGNQPLTWGDKTNKVLTMSGMFNGATSFNQNLSGWNIVNVANMTSMFNNSGMSNINNDTTLNGWYNLAISPTGVKSTVSLGASDMFRTSNSNDAVNYLSGTKGWTFTTPTYTLLSISANSVAGGSFDNTSAFSFSMTGTSDNNTGTPFTYVLSNPNFGAFTSSTGTMNNIGGNNYEGIAIFAATGATGGTSATWYFKNSTGRIQSPTESISFTITCLDSSTAVLTPNGYLPITTLKEGYLITTDDGRNVPITQVHRSLLLDRKGEIIYKICKDAIRPGYPSQDVILTAGHSILLEPEKGNLEGEWISTLYLPKKYPGVVSLPSEEPYELYHLHLPSFFDDNLVVNGGFVVESQGDFKNIWRDTGKNDYTKYKEPKLRY